ncbi:hypothetical protein GGI43DRAFT_171487 [Trichoderma evansii]
MAIFAVIIASQAWASRVQIGNNIRSNGLRRQVGMQRHFFRSVVRTKPVYCIMLLLQARTKIRGSYRSSFHAGSNLLVLSKIKLEAAFVYEIFGHTLVQVSAQLMLIDVFVLSSRAIGWLAPRIIMLDRS